MRNVVKNRVCYICQHILAYITLIVCANSYSAIIATDTGVSLYQATESAVDILTINPPNISGISVNYFSEFAVDTQPLHILNAPRTINKNGVNVIVPPAQTIIVVADNIDLRNYIQLLGATSDVVFIASDSSGRIDCSLCEFDNIARLSLLASSTPIPDDITELGSIQSSVSSVVSINNLDAPGVMGVDILAGDLHINGTINTHQQASIDPLGGYTIGKEGAFRVGSGSVNIMMGDVDWHYANNMIQSVGASDTQAHTLGGEITSSGIKISTTNHIVLRTTLDTSSDLLSAVSYREGAYLPQEGIDVQTFMNGDLTIDVNQISTTMAFKSTGSLVLHDQATLKAGNVELIAGNRLTTLGKIDAATINVAGDTTINQGELLATTELNLWARKELANQYGGELKANVIRLQSVTQAVRNGSRTSYISRDHETNSLFDFENYINALNPLEGGLFYQSSQAAATGVLVKAANSSAKIFADRIEVQAIGFENINPYYEKIKSDDTVELNTNYLQQVTISAESALNIAATSYVVNSSAQLLLNSPDGELNIDTALLTNERYRVTQTLERKDVAVNRHIWFGTDVSSLIYQNHNLVYSPPGVISIAGSVNIKASQGVVNNTSTFEVLGNATFEAPAINSIGVEDENVERCKKEETVWARGRDGDKHSQIIRTNDICISELTRTRADLDEQIKELEKSWGGSDIVESLREFLPHLFVVAAASKDNTLFSIQGNFYTNDSLVRFSNHKPFDRYVEQAIASVAGNASTASISTAEEARESGVIKVGTKTYSLFTELQKVVNRLKQSVTDFFAELDWWN